MKISIKKTIVKLLILTISLVFVGLLFNEKIEVKADNTESYDDNGTVITFDTNFASLNNISDGIPTGNYYLSGDYYITGVNYLKVNEGSTVNLYLNGFFIGYSALNRNKANSIIKNYGTLNIYDDTDSTTTHKFIDTMSVTIGRSGDDLNHVLYTDGEDLVPDTIYNSATENFTEITGGGFYGGVAKYGSFLYNEGTFKMHGGNVIGCCGTENSVVYEQYGSAEFCNVNFEACLCEYSALISCCESTAPLLTFNGTIKFKENIINTHSNPADVQDNTKYIFSNGYVILYNNYFTDFIFENNFEADIPLTADEPGTITNINVNGITENDIAYYNQEYSKEGVNYTKPSSATSMYIVNVEDAYKSVEVPVTEIGTYHIYLYGNPSTANAENEQSNSNLLELKNAITITKKELEVSWCEDDFTYNGEYQIVEAKYTDVYGTEHSLTVKLSKNFKYAGSYTATASFNKDDSTGPSYYTLKESTTTSTFTMKQKVIEIEWVTDYTYNNQEQAVLASYKDVDGNTVSLSTKIKDDKVFKDVDNEGYTAIITTTINDSNYTLTGSVTEQEVTMHPMTITIIWTTEYVYNGEEQNGIACYEKLNGYKDGLSVTFDENVEFKNAGTYTAHASFSIAGIDENYALPEITAQTLTISPKEIEIVWCEDDYTYSGDIQVVEAHYLDTSNEKIALNVSVENIFKDAGSYTFTASFKNSETNYKLPSDIQKVYTMKKLKVDEPTVSGTYTYSKEEQSVVLLGYDTSYMYVGSSTKETDAGTYDLMFMLDSNHEWNDGVDGRVLWIINKATFDTSNLKWDYVNPKTFNSSNIEIKVVGIPSGVTVSKYTNNKKFNVGRYTAKVEFEYDKNNYNEVSLPDLDWEIVVAENSITLSRESFEVTYTGEKVELPNAESDFGTISCNYRSENIVNAGVYNVVYTVEETSNYKGATKEITITVNKKQVKEPFVVGTYKYTGIKQQADVRGYVEKYMSTEDSIIQTETGTYKIHYTLDSNYEWAPGSDGDVYWEIRKASFGSTETGIKDKSQIVITCSDGITGDVTMTSDFVSEENAQSYSGIVNYNNLPEDIKLAANEKISAIYKIELYKIVDGVEVALQPSDISETGKITVKILIPVDVDPSDIKRIIHVHSAENIKSIDIEDVDIINGYITFEVSELSEFALVTNQSFVSSKTFTYILIGAGAILVIAVAIILINRAANKKAERERNAGNRYYVDKRKK